MMHKLDHTPYINKQIVELVVTSLAANIVSRANRMSFGLQNGSTPHEPTSHDSHVILGEEQPSFVHLPTLVGGNYLPI
jgi:hypothetical protein